MTNSKLVPKNPKFPKKSKKFQKSQNGMSSIGYLGRFFETARTALPGKAPQKKIFKKKSKK
jgi:hypothetical protein